MKRFSVVLCASVLALTACSQSDPVPQTSQDPITEQLVGKRLVGPGLTLRLLEGNQLAGRAGTGNQVSIDGAWEIREGRFCRTISQPSQLAGTECQDITIDGETATLVGRDGPQTFIIEDN